MKNAFRRRIGTVTLLVTGSPGEARDAATGRGFQVLSAGPDESLFSGASRVKVRKVGLVYARAAMWFHDCGPSTGPGVLLGYES